MATATKAPARTRRHTIHDPSIGRRLLEARTRAGISQQTLCRDTVYTSAFLSRVEQGQRTPSVRAIRIWARILGCSAAWLETGEDVVDVRMSTFTASELSRWLTSNPSAITYPSHLCRALHEALGE